MSLVRLSLTACLECRSILRMVVVRWGKYIGLGTQIECFHLNLSVMEHRVGLQELPQMFIFKEFVSCICERAKRREQEVLLQLWPVLIKDSAKEIRAFTVSLSVV